MRVPVPLLPCQHLFYLVLVLICISLMTNDVGHFVLHLFIDHSSSFVECLLKSFAHFNRVNCLLFIELKEFLIYYEYNSFVSYMFCEYFLQVESCLSFF